VAPRRPARTPSKATPPTVDQVVDLAVRHNLAEIEVEADGTRIRVVREHAPAVGIASRVEAAPGTAPLAQPATAPTESTDHLVPVEAPMVGTFYRAPKPDAPPFVSEGDVVKEGQVLCIVEAMKLMNEIEAKAAGRIVKILVDNGQPVEFGQSLFLMEPLR
jgi:acetyl-CoA carboxylase biotin carboxyl carrier protein